MRNLNAPQTDKFIRLRKRSKPFVFEKPDIIGGHLWCYCWLYGSPLKHFRFARFQIPKRKQVLKKIISEVHSIGLSATKSKAELYVKKYCTTNPLRLPDEDEFEKFKLMKGLQ